MKDINIYMMYRVKKGTVNDVEEIWQIIEKTWLYGKVSEAGRTAAMNMLNVTHSLKKIQYQIINHDQHYLLVVENDHTLAFASYSTSGSYPPDFKIHEIYAAPCVQDKGYHEILIKHVEEIALKEGSKHVRVHVSERKKKEYFETLGFVESTTPVSARYGPQQGFEMIKNI